MSLISLSVFVLFAVLLQTEVLMGLIDQHESNALSFFNIVSASLFVLLMRSNVRLPDIGDPNMTAVQIGFALVSQTN